MCVCVCVCVCVLCVWLWGVAVLGKVAEFEATSKAVGPAPQEVLDDMRVNLSLISDESVVRVSRHSLPPSMHPSLPHSLPHARPPFLPPSLKKLNMQT